MDQADLDTINDALAEMKDVLASMRVDLAEVEKEASELSKQTAEQNDEIADARRAGKDGRDWQTLQQRIDMRQTTMRDIIGGVDKSTEAVAVRAEIGGRIAETRTLLSEQVSQEDLDALARTQADLAAAMEKSKSEFNRYIPF